MNQLRTKNDRIIINRVSRTPIFTKTVEHRIRSVKQELGINYRVMSISDRWASIQADVKRLILN